MSFSHSVIMDRNLSASPESPDHQGKSADVSPSLSDLRQLVEARSQVLQPLFADELQGDHAGGAEPRRLAGLSEELTFDLLQLRRQTERELGGVRAQLLRIEGHRQLLSAELSDLREKKQVIEQEVKADFSLQATTCQLRVCRQLQASVAERLLQSERLLFQEEALRALHHLLTQDLRWYREETQRLSSFRHRVLQTHRRSAAESQPTGRSSRCSMQGKSETEHNNMRSPKSPSSKGAFSDEDDQVWPNSAKSSISSPFRSTNLHRTGSIQNLIHKFSGPDDVFTFGNGHYPTRPGRMTKAYSVEVLDSPPPATPSSATLPQSPIPSITVTPTLAAAPAVPELAAAAGAAEKSPKSSKISGRTDDPVGAKQDTSKAKSKTQNSSKDFMVDSGMGSESELDSNRQADSPSEEEPLTPRPVTAVQNPKYQLFLSNDPKTNGVSGKDADGPGGGGSLGENGPNRLSRWETNRLAVHRGSSESLASRDLDSAADRVGVVDSPPRVFNSPYSSTLSLDYNPTSRMSEFKGGLSPATSELNLYTRSTSPVVPLHTPMTPMTPMSPMTPLTSMGQPRQRFSAYDTLLRRRTEINNPVPQIVHTHYSTMRPGTLGPNRQDFIEELSKQLDACQKRNQFLEAESVEMEKERNQIRFEMRGLLVNNEDLLRTNSQLNNEMKRLREQMIEIDRERQARDDKIREMEIEVKEARSMMVEANSQEYAFNFLQQSLKNRIQDAEESLEKQTQYSQSLSEKLWHAERQLEELEIDKDTKDKKRSELTSTILRLETELAEALQSTSQAAAELSLQQKLREDSELRVEELEESLLEKEQELQRQHILIARLQGEVSGKLIDKEQTLEEEIQLRERIDLQRKQAERTVDDLKMELHTAHQAKDELAKQVKQAQEKMIDLESEVEELHDSEQRWAVKHKRAVEQTEQLQLKLLQEKDLNDQLELSKATMERQLRELRMEMEDLQTSKVQEDVISRSEIRVKELENLMRTEERNKVVLTNTISKLERKINELTDQMEEDHRVSTEQKDLMAQRIRSLKRQLNETEEEASRKDAQYRHTQRELAEERETSSRLQRQLLEQHLQTKRKETLSIRHTLDSLRLDLSVDDEDEEQQQQQQQQQQKEEEQEGSVTKV